MRRTRVEHVVAQGKKNGDQKAAGPVGRFFRDLILPIIFKRMASQEDRAQGWMHKYHIDWEAPVENGNPWQARAG